jgi:ribosomal protein S20
MFRTSEQTDKLDAALAKAQSQIDSASKDKVNPAFRSKYADLTAVWEACRAALTGNGISVSQWPVHSDDNRLHLITRLACEGEWMLCEFSIPTSKQDAHGYGSAVTYAKRFSLAAAVGVVADDDDDGNAASGRGTNTAAEPPKKDRGQMHGPMSITELKNAMKEFARDLEGCSDADELNALISTSQPVIEQCKRDLPDWYFGKEGTDVKGAQDRILARTEELNPKAA